MNSDQGRIKPSARSKYEEGPKVRYNPFRKLAKRAKQSRREQDDAFHDSNHLTPPLPGIGAITREDTPSIVGQLFGITDLRSDLAANDDASTVRPGLGDIGTPSFGRLIDEERPSSPFVETGSQLNPWRPNFLLNTLGRAYVDSASPQPKHFFSAPSALEYTNDARKRRVIVVEFGNTDNLTKGALNINSRQKIVAYPSLVTAETIRQSWKDPIYSEMAAPGYPIGEKGHGQSRSSSALGKALKESLRKVCVSLCISSLWRLMLLVYASERNSKYEDLVRQCPITLSERSLKDSKLHSR